ncbi:MAG: glucose-1-phosphate thymidylyltransferase [bacterium]|nr:glucose-1-phosphate thymidylyltransferase [bacterium]
MKALITAGGRATRLRPITHTINKHLIAIANKPMIFYAIEKIVEAGIREIGININEGDQELPAVIGNGDRWGVHITYLEQSGGAKGLAHIIKNAKDKKFLDGPFLMYLGDNVILGSITHLVEKFKNDQLHCLLTLATVRDPQRFGVPEIRDGRIVRVFEKPSNPPSQFAITGIYLFDHNALDAVESIQPSARGEYEITDVQQYYIDRGLNVGFEEITGWWKDTGKPEDLLEANQLMLSELARGESVNKGTVHPNARVQGKVWISPGAKIGPEVLIRGPVIIGEGTTIERSYIGPYTAIGNNVCMHDTELEHSIVFDDAHLACGKRIVDSVVGLGARIISQNDSLPRGHRLIVGDQTVVEL